MDRRAESKEKERAPLGKGVAIGAADWVCLGSSFTHRGPVLKIGVIPGILALLRPFEQKALCFRMRTELIAMMNSLVLAV